MRARGLLWVIPFMLGLGPGVAQAQAKGDNAVCIEAYEQVQALREQGQLIEAREKAVLCAAQTCPKVLAGECAGWLTQVTESTPSVVLAATDAQGNDLVDVRVTVDGKVVTEQLGARAVPLNPGTHKFLFESKPHGTSEVSVVLREGEKARKISVSLKPVVAGTAPQPSAPESERPVPISFWLVGGVGAAAVGGGVVFESLGLVKAGELEDCKPACAKADVDEMSRNFLIGDVAVGVGALGLGAALLVYLTRPEVAPAASKPAVSFDAGPTGAMLRARF